MTAPPDARSMSCVSGARGQWDGRGRPRGLASSERGDPGCVVACSLESTVRSHHADETQTLAGSLSRTRRGHRTFLTSPIVNRVEQTVQSSGRCDRNVGIPSLGHWGGVRAKRSPFPQRRCRPRQERSPTRYPSPAPPPSFRPSCLPHRHHSSHLRPRAPRRSRQDRSL